MVAKRYFTIVFPIFETTKKKLYLQLVYSFRKPTSIEVNNKLS